MATKKKSGRKKTKTKLKDVKMSLKKSGKVKGGLLLPAIQKVRDAAP